MKIVNQSPTSKYIFKPTLFQDISKKDGVISLILVVLFEICSTFLIVIAINNDIATMGRLLYFLSSTLFFPFLLILNKNKLYTLGLRKNNMKITLSVFVILFVISISKNMQQIQSHKITIYDFIVNVLFYLIILFFTEEFIYRGYLWPRLVVLLGNHKGTILCGAMWGVMHIIIDFCYGDADMTYLTIFNSITSGISGQYIFSFLYACSQNIYLPTIIHASFHFFEVDKTLNYFIKLINII